MQMAQSKFPGKPSKPVKRRRVNVLKEEHMETGAAPAEGLQDSVGNSPDSQTSAKSVSRKRTATRRKPNRLEQDRSVITKRRRFTNSTLIKSLSARQTTKRSENQSSNSSNRKANVESNNTVGTFVLPTRSAHSSRVIKPNKRFLNVDADTTITPRPVPAKKRPVRKRKNSQNDENVGKSHGEDKVLPDTDTSMSRLQNSNRRVVLRQARLQLDTQRSKCLEGPFSSTVNNNHVSSPGTVTCGVCGAVRFYRFVNQARKFNIYSCESCRKFISKMIKRQRCNKTSILQCLKDNGTCLVPPVLRSQIWKSRCAYKARCSACWLKMCIRSFQMPQTLKTGLMGLLPVFMRETNMVFNNSTLFSFHTTNPNLSQGPNLQSNETAKVVPRRVLRRKVDKDSEKSNISVPTEIKRQKIDLKGPRVKHVCRSASIVLGQAAAIFPETDKPSDATEMSKSDINSCDASENKENDSSNEENCLKSNIKSESVMVESNEDGAVSAELKPVPVKTEISSLVVSKRERDQLKPFRVPKSAHCTQIKFAKMPSESPNRICYNFWENYDLDEVGQYGFGLIAPGAFQLVSICFLCGSVGQDPLLYCCSCCEPYHPFCLEHFPSDINPYNQYDWLCPRCTKCTACGKSEEQRVYCHKCHKPYHPKCFNVEWQSGIKQTVCSTCMRCKSCGTSNATKFIGNTTLCDRCFKLRKKGNYCPLCNGCYEADDYDIKMMECGKCSMWVHAKCEGLSHEQYQILSTLPDSVEYLCCVCEPLPYWRKAVDIELRSCFNKILKLLSKNKVARTTLKWNPLHFKSPTLKSKHVQRLFVDQSDNDETSEPSYEDINIDISDNELKTSIVVDVEENSISVTGDNDILRTPTSPSLSCIKNKINCQEFFTAREFNISMEEIIIGTNSTELRNIYHSILKETLPWFDRSTVCEDTDVSFCDTSRVNNARHDCPELQDIRYTIIGGVASDTRTCALCKGVGDGPLYKESRLMYCGNNEWVHGNCAMWSSEVHEEIDGSLQQVLNAIHRGRLMSCTHCKLKGASIGCCSKTCPEIYHFTCAYNKQCHFMSDKSFFCHRHYKPGSKAQLTLPSEFVLSRSIHIELDQSKKRYAESDHVTFMAGSLNISCLGVIQPEVSDTSEALVPLNFSCTRLFWSTNEPWKLVPYAIKINMRPFETSAEGLECNFTIDHSLPKSVLSEKLRELSAWQRDIDTEMEVDEEPQNENAPDFLSPELTDAILEELPQGVFDRISMQDIFPKLLGSEELLGPDLKLSDISNTEIDLNEEIVDNNGNSRINSNKISKLQNSPRCSVSVSCKVDNSLTPTSMSRSQNKNFCLPLLQVDGTCDNSSNSSSDGESTIQDVEDLYIPQLSDEPVSCQRCQCTYRTQASYTRHLETCDNISMSDSDSEIVFDTDQFETAIYSSISPTLDSGNIESVSVMPINEINNVEEPYILNSQELYMSYQQAQTELFSENIDTQSFISSEPTLDVLPVPETEIYYSDFQPELETKSDTIYNENASLATETFPVALNPPLDCDSTQVTIGTAQTLSFNQQPNQILNHNNSLYLSQSSYNHPSTISLVQPPSLPINQAAAIALNGASPFLPIETQQLTIQSIPLQHEITPLLTITPQNQITLGTTKFLPNHLMAVSSNQVVRPTVHTVIAPKTVRPRGRPRSLAVRRTIRPTIYVPPQGSSSVPSVLIHQLSSSNMIPTFLESFQQQTGQNLQLVTSVTPQMAPMVNQSHMVQFQPENTVVNLLPGVQPTTVILPQGQAQLLNDQIIVDPGNSLMWSPQPLQTIQPIIYGYETIVQNTVLQSQQFLPSTVPGILTSNSSFSSTTQVFQTSKLEPILDVASGNYVLVNSNSAVNSQPVPQHVVTQVPPATEVPEEELTLNNTYIQPNIEAFQPQEPVNALAYAFTTTSMSDMISKLNRNINGEFIISSDSSINTNNSINSSINLPVASFLQDTGLPTSKPISTMAQSRPMSRVLPMPTKTSKVITNKSIMKNTNEIPASPEKPKTDEKQLETLIEDLIKPNFDCITVDAQVAPINVITNFQSGNTCKDSKAPTSNKIIVTAIVEPPKPLRTKNDLVTSKSSTDQSHQKSSEKQMKENIANSTDNDIVAKNTITKVNEISEKIKEKFNLLIEGQSYSKNSTSSSAKPTKLIDKSFDAIQECSTSFRSNNHLKTKSLELDEEWRKLLENESNSNDCSISVIERKTAENTNTVDKGVSIIKKTMNLNLKSENCNEENSNEKNLDSINEKCISTSTKHTLKCEKSQQNLGNMFLYTIDTSDGFHYTSTSLSDLWSKVFESIQAARIKHNMLPLPENSMNIMGGFQMLGLKSNRLKYLLEQLPKASKCSKYKPTFGFKKQEMDSDDEEIQVDISQGSRSIQYIRSHDPSDMFGWLASKHRRPIWNHYVSMDENSRRAGVLPISTWMKFRNLKLTSKHSVGVYPSKIHKRGLFCHRDIESGDMVIEYAGEVIRSILADIREKQYTDKGMGCYMFRIDDYFVVDATMKGNAARFINHSCEPNCYSKVIEVSGHKHIVIFALRKLVRGEELTYDYKFPLEEDKLLCTCGTRRCRKFLN